MASLIPRPRRAALALVTVLALAPLAAPLLARATTTSARAKIYVQIALSVPSSAITGDPLPISVEVTSSGVPVAKHLIRIYVDDTELAAVETNAEGRASTTLRTALATGTHTVTATFHGGGPIQPASASRTITISPAPLSIRVVPFIPNAVTVSVDGGPPLSPNVDGFITTPLAKGGHVTLQAVVHDPSSDVKVSFVSWSNNDVSPLRVVDVRQKLYTQLALQISYLTQLRFVDAAGDPMPPGSVSGVHLTGPDGQQIDQGRNFTVWLSTPVPRKTSTGALAVGADVYTATNAYYQAVNVADEGADRYIPRAGGVWTVRLAAYPVTIRAKNLFFGGGVTAKVAVTGAGRRHVLQLGSAQGATLVVPRGRYTVRLLSGGLSPSLKIGVSRDSVVPMPVVTVLDLIVLALIVLAIVALVILLHPMRRWRRHRAGRQELEASP